MPRAEGINILLVYTCTNYCDIPEGQSMDNRQVVHQYPPRFDRLEDVPMMILDTWLEGHFPCRSQFVSLIPIALFAVVAMNPALHSTHVEADRQLIHIEGCADKMRSLLSICRKIDPASSDSCTKKHIDLRSLTVFCIGLIRKRKKAIDGDDRRKTNTYDENVHWACTTVWLSAKIRTQTTRIDIISLQTKCFFNFKLSTFNPISNNKNDVLW